MPDRVVPLFLAISEKVVYKLTEARFVVLLIAQNDEMFDSWEENCSLHLYYSSDAPVFT